MDWHRYSTSATGEALNSYEFSFKNNVEQKAFFIFEAQYPKTVPKGCDKDKFSYDINIHQVDESGYDVKSWSSQIWNSIAYGEVYIKDLKPSKYRVVIANSNSEMTKP